MKSANDGSIAKMKYESPQKRKASALVVDMTGNGNKKRKGNGEVIVIE